MDPSEPIPDTDDGLFTDPTDLPEQIEVALKAHITNISKKPKVCICGVGASGMAGEIMSDFADASSDVPISVVHGAELPRWVDEDTAVIAISYSGNTPETLRLYDQAASRGCYIICITSGGDLMEKALANDNPLIRVPPSLLPRNALGYMLGSTASVFEDMGICASRTQLMTLLPALRQFRDNIAKNEHDNRALEIANAIHGRTPVIYSLVNLRAAAIRWKMQISENSRTIAFYGTIPEFSHNEIVGWAEDNASDEFIPIILADDDSTDVLRYMTETLSGVLESNGIRPYEYKVKGSSDLERNLMLIILGDFVSVYLAYLKGIYPGKIQLEVGNGGRREFN